MCKRLKRADKERQYQEFKDKAGQIISGIVKRVEYGNIYLDLGKAEAFMRRMTLFREVLDQEIELELL